MTDWAHGPVMLDVAAVDAVVREQRQHGVVGLGVSARVHVHRVTLDTCTSTPTPIRKSAVAETKLPSTFLLLIQRVSKTVPTLAC